MRTEEILNLAETHGWIDDYNRWNFKNDEQLLAFVDAIVLAEREDIANQVKAELDSVAFMLWSEIRDEPR
jgi:hypothetical protein